tara:strand:+ start:453 stop:626 length:174 start_codon:yes stop_codon:yes gene_type:complete
MKKVFLLIQILSTLILLPGCTPAEIETKANEAGNAVGTFIRGASEGFVKGFSGKEQK